MRILLLHNRYRKSGGEDAALESEQQILAARGHQVHVAFSSNETPGGLASLRLVLHSAWSRHSFDRVRKLCRSFRPDIAHVHNFWMSWTPSIHAACRAERVATVQTLHNFRLFCVNGICLRDDRPCTDCLAHSPLRGILHRCYRGSALASASAARMISANRRRRTWDTDVNAFIVPSEHARLLHLQDGLPPGRVFVKPNLVRDRGCSPVRPSQSRSIAYIGRLSPEKGIAVLLDAWTRARRPSGSRLILVGEEQVPGAYPRNAPDVVFAGRADRHQVSRILAEARAVVAPSLCFETFGMSVVEAFAAGRAAIVSDIGALAEMVDHGKNGLKCRAGSAEDLARQIEAIFQSESFVDELGAKARAEYLRRFSVESTYRQLMNIYAFALRDASAQPAALGAAV